MKNVQENFNQDVDSMVSLMESAEEFMFESEDKQANIKAAIEANKRRKEHEQKSAINSDKSEAYSLLAQGKRNLFVKDYESAVSTLGEACEKLSSIYGEFAVELGDAYMTYGNALLELWRIEEAEKKNNEDETEEAKEEPENENENDNEDEANEEEVNKETENDGEDDKEDGEGEGDGDDEEKNNEEEEEEGEEDIENEEDNLQIAWEVIELAKEIYVRHDDNLNAAKAYLKLGEISIASANYTLAIEDLGRSLQMQEKLTSADNRLKANTHFNLCVAYAASHNYDKSAEQLDTAKSVFETQVYDLSEKLKTMDKSNVPEITKIKKEIDDTEEILRDMDSKVLENNKHKREFMRALLEAIKNKTSDQSSNSHTSNNLLPPGSSSAAPVNNISHLIHKKPKQKQEDSAEKELPQSKLNPVTQNSTIPNGKSSPNSNSEPSNGSTENNDSSKSDDQSESNEKKRKLSETLDDSSPKKVCLRQE